MRRGSTRCCRRPSARAAAIRAADRTPRRSPRRGRDQPMPARRQRDHRGARRLLGRPALPLNPAQRRGSGRRRSRGSTKRAASAAPGACRPARSMRSSAPRNSCTPCSPRDARAASCASPPCPVDCIELAPARRRPAGRPPPIARASRPHTRPRCGAAPRSASANSTRKRPARRAAGSRGAMKPAKRREIFARLRGPIPHRRPN